MQADFPDAANVTVAETRTIVHDQFSLEIGRPLLFVAIYMERSAHAKVKVREGFFVQRHPQVFAFPKNGVDLPILQCPGEPGGGVVKDDFIFEGMYLGDSLAGHMVLGEAAPCFDFGKLGMFIYVQWLERFARYSSHHDRRAL